MAENNVDAVKYTTPFSLQSLARLSLIKNMTISNHRRSNSFKMLGHAAKLKCIKSLETLDIVNLDFSSVSKADLENVLSVVKYQINVNKTMNVERLFEAGNGIVPYGEEPPCRHHTRLICTKCTRGYCKDFICPCEVIIYSIVRYDYH